MNAALDLPLPESTDTVVVQPESEPAETAETRRKPKSAKTSSQLPEHRRRMTSAEYKTAWRTFMPKDSIALFPLELELGSAMAQQRFGEWFGRVQSATHMLCDALPNIMKNPQQSQDVLNVLTAQMSMAAEQLNDQLGQLRERCSEVGLRQERMWSRPLNLTVPCSNRFHRDFLNLARLFDDIVWHLEALATFGEITNQVRITERNKASKLVARVSLDTAQLWKRARASVDRNNPDETTIQALNAAEDASHAQGDVIIACINAQVSEHAADGDVALDVEAD